MRQETEFTLLYPLTYSNTLMGKKGKVSPRTDRERPEV